MREIKWAGAFKRDFKRESQGRLKKAVKEVFPAVVDDLANDRPLDEKYHDHNLTGNWSGYRECHLKPDLLLIYKKIDDDDKAILCLARLGSHSELFE